MKKKIFLLAIALSALGIGTGHATDRYFLVDPTQELDTAATETLVVIGKPASGLTITSGTSYGNCALQASTAATFPAAFHPGRSYVAVHTDSDPGDGRLAATVFSPTPPGNGKKIVSINSMPGQTYCYETVDSNVSTLKRMVGVEN